TLAERGCDPLRRPELRCRMINQDFSLAAVGDDDAVRAQRDVFHCSGVDDAHENDVARPRHFGRAARGLETPARCRPGFRRVDIEAHDPVAFLGEPASKTFYHQAEADEADRCFRHERFSTTLYLGGVIPIWLGLISVSKDCSGAGFDAIFGSGAAAK